jgi:hypothetical protein
MVGLKLEAAFNRSHTVTIGMEWLTSGKVSSKINSLNAAGSRTVTWSAHEVGETTVTDVKTIETQVTRSHLVMNSKGEKVNMEWQLATKEGAPLEVEVVRNQASRELVSKSIKSGTLVSIRKNDGKIESQFDNFKLSFAAGSCKFESGTVTLSFYKEGEESAVRNYKLAIDSEGGAMLTDVATGAEVSDFEVAPCSMVDFKY